jgi:hypothetical protein
MAEPGAVEPAGALIRAPACLGAPSAAIER